jgi:hypothetical protein
MECSTFITSCQHLQQDDGVLLGGWEAIKETVRGCRVYAIQGKEGSRPRWAASLG